MRKFTLLLLAFIFTVNGALASYPGETPSYTSVTAGKLSAVSTTTGSHPCPSMTDAQMLAIAAPSNGDCVHNTTLQSWLVYDSVDVAWEEVGGSGGGIADWMTATDYEVGDVVIESFKLYRSKTIHTSGATFAGDLAVNWDQLAHNVSDATGTLPINHGGTNSSAALTGSAIAVSNGTAIVQGAAGTTTTVLHGNAAGLPTYGAVSLTSDVSGILPLVNGGSNKAAVASAGSVVYSDVDSFELSAVGTSGQALLSAGAGAPAFGALDLSTAAVTGIVPMAKGGTNKNATANNGAVAYSDADSFELLAPGTSGQILQTNGAGAPTFVNKSISAKRENSTSVTLEELQVPNDQLTTTATNKFLIDNCGNSNNLLVNCGFEHTTFDTGWTSSGVTASAETSILMAGKKAFKAVIAAAASPSIKQSSTLYASQFDETEGIGSMWISNTASDMYLCPVYAGVSITSGFDSSCIALDESGVYLPYFLDMYFGATSNGIEIKSSQAVVTGGTLYAESAVVAVVGTESQTTTATVQENDSHVSLRGAGGYGAVNTKIAIFTTVDQNFGSDITYATSANNGASFTVNTSGIYSMQWSADSASANLILGFSVNSTQLTTNIQSITASQILSYTVTGSGSGAVVAYEGFFNAGDIIRPHGSGVNINTSYRLSISKQGSLKRVTVNKNQKIKIPNSFVRFEGTSSKGAVDTFVVKFDTMTSLVGDAFEVVNNANNGTYVKVKRNGIVNVNTGFATPLGQIGHITKNQVVLTTYPVPSETYGSINQNSTAGGRVTGAAEFPVVVGDIIRVTLSGTPTAETWNHLNISFQEQEVQVSVANTLPQYSEDDSSIRVRGANGYGSTNNKIYRFNTVDLNYGTSIIYQDSATLGSSFTAQEDGEYSATFSSDSSALTYFGLSKNTTAPTSPITTVCGNANDECLAIQVIDAGTRSASVSWSGRLLKGDILRVHTDGQAVSDADSSRFSISKVGKPNVTGVDVTAFVNASQVAVDEIRFGTGTGFGASYTTARTFGVPTKRVSNGVIDYVTDATGTYIIALKQAEVKVSWQGFYDTNSVSTSSITLNQSGSGVSTNQIAMLDKPSSLYAGMSTTVVMEIGDKLRFNTNATPLVATDEKLQVTAIASSSATLTAPDTFSTDTNTLTYAGSGTYTLATLANAPVGTFITATYAASSNTRTQTTSAPTQTTADMNQNGIQLFPRPWNAVSTFGNPSWVAIQIGKNMKGAKLNAYFSTGKTAPMYTDWFLISATIEEGLKQAYNEVTGVLTIDAGESYNNTTTRYIGALVDTVGSNINTSGYIVVNASKNPALTGVNSSLISTRVVNTAGTSIANSGDTKIPLDATATFNQNFYVDFTNNRIYASDSGTFEVSAAIQFASLVYASGNVMAVKVYKNGVLYSTLGSKTVDGTPTAKQGVQGTDQIRLNKNDYIEFYAANSRTAGASALSTTAGDCFMNIKRLIGGL
jgi:hypothetical protein